MRVAARCALLTVCACVHVASAAAQDLRLVPDGRRAVRDTLGGAASAYTIASPILGQRRRVSVVLPPSHARTTAARRYPVVVVLDGETSLAPVAAAVDQLTRNGLLPEVVLVGVENEGPASGRVYDLTPPGLSVSGSDRSQGGDRFLDFLERELLPAVERQFRADLPRVLVGHSSGGVLATYAAATRPGFRVAIALDAPLFMDDYWLAAKLVSGARARQVPLRYLYYGAAYDWRDTDWRALRAALRPGSLARREHLAGEGHETVALLGAYLGLRDAFADFGRLAAPSSVTARVLPHYDSVSAALGAALAPPRRVLEDLVDDLLLEGRGVLARDAYERLVAAYGAPDDAPALRARIADAERLPPPTETVDALLAASSADSTAAARVLGDWVGDAWLGDGEPQIAGRLTLRVHMERGRAVADLVRRTGSDSVVSRVGHFRVAGDSVVYGVLNGMRPRGVMLFEGRIVGDTLAGRSRWGGIRFREADGTTGDGLRFRYARRPPGPAR